MRYKIFNLLFLFIIFSCVNKPSIETDNTIPKKSFFISKGFALVYDDKIYNQKLIKGKIADRSLVIFQKNLKRLIINCQCSPSVMHMIKKIC